MAAHPAQHMGTGVLMIDDAQTVRFRRGPLPVKAPPRYATPPGPWGPPPAGLGGPGVPAPIVLPPLSLRPRWPWVLGAVAAVVVVLGLLGSVLAPSTTVSGTVSLDMNVYLPLGTSCEGVGSYSDLHGGGSVTVHDEAGDLAGVGSLSGGTTSSSSSSVYGYGDICVFPYSISDVDDAKRYVVSAGTRHGAGVSFSEDEIAGHADISIG